MLKFCNYLPDTGNMRIENIAANTPREAIEYVRSILPVTAAKSTTLTARRTSNSTFEVYA